MKAAGKVKMKGKDPGDRRRSAELEVAKHGESKERREGGREGKRAE